MDRLTPRLNKLLGSKSILRAAVIRTTAPITRINRHGQAFRSLSTTCCRRRADDERKWSTPLAKQLGEAIAATGPVPLASFMRMCLTADVGGYYTGAIEDGRDQFGATGDFVTSPEISQVFGELIGVWFVTEWVAQGRPKKGVELIELGPGRGTLMDDMLRTFQNIGMADSIDAIYLVEASPELRTAQKKLLCGEDVPLEKSEVGYQAVSRHRRIPIIWTEDMKCIPANDKRTPFIVAHEFFDALPIHAFQCVKGRPTETAPSDGLQWRELLVSPTPPDSTHASLGTPRSQSHDTPPPDFQLTVAKAGTRHSLYLPECSPRYRAIRSQTGEGALVEICPDLSLYAGAMAARIGGPPEVCRRPSGAALMIDYGPGDGSVPTNSLRGIRRHRRVSPFAEPGLTDLSADVDFAAAAEAATAASPGVEVHGPVDQSAFLDMLGLRERTAALARAARARGDQRGAEAVERASRRLVDRGPNGMGKMYKVLAIVPENGGRRRPVGFGGDVVE